MTGVCASKVCGSASSVVGVSLVMQICSFCTKGSISIVQIHSPHPGGGRSYEERLDRVGSCLWPPTRRPERRVRSHVRTPTTWGGKPVSLLWSQAVRFDRNRVALAASSAYHAPAHGAAPSLPRPQRPPPPAARPVGRGAHSLDTGRAVRVSPGLGWSLGGARTGPFAPHLIPRDSFGCTGGRWIASAWDRDRRRPIRSGLVSGRPVRSGHRQSSNGLPSAGPHENRGLPGNVLHFRRLQGVRALRRARRPARITPKSG